MSGPDEGLAADLERMAELLSHHRTGPQTWVHPGSPQQAVRDILRRHGADWQALLRATNTAVFWAGIGSVSNQTLNENPGMDAARWDMEIRELRELLVALGGRRDGGGRDRPHGPAPDGLPASKRRLMDVFVPRSRDWREAVVRRGVLLATGLLDHMPG